MVKKIYVGNLSYTTTEESLIRIFSEYGTVDSAIIITDRDTGRSRGFGFVEMSTADEAASAISYLKGKELDGRKLNLVPADS